MPPILTRRYWTYARFDRLLNRVLLGCVGFIFILVIIVDDGTPSPRTTYSDLGTTSFISILQSPCETLDERIAFFEACRPLNPDAEGSLVVCPSPAPEGVEFRPTSKALATSTVNALKSRKASPICGYMSLEPLDVPDLKELDWSESQKRMLDQLESTKEAADKVNEQRRALREGAIAPQQSGDDTEDKTDDQN